MMFVRLCTARRSWLCGPLLVRELDAFLIGKDTVGQEIEEAVCQRAGELGLKIASVGIRDVILPGEMKDLMNKVTEAKKAAEANLISCREETAAIRSQANTAKLLVENPGADAYVRELEVLEDRLGGLPARCPWRREGSCRPRDQPAVTTHAPGPSNGQGRFFAFKNRCKVTPVDETEASCATTKSVSNDVTDAR